MLNIQQLSGFNAIKLPDPRIRYVGDFSLSYGGTTTGTATITVASLQFSPSPFRQILVGWQGEVPFILSAQINGVDANPFTMEVSRFCCFCAAFNQSVADFNFTCTIAATSTEVGRVSVWEVEYAAPLWESFHQVAVPATVNAPLPLVIPERGVAAGTGMATGDTVTHTWNTPLTETSDADFGDYRGTTATLVTPQTAVSRTRNNMTASSGSAHAVAIGICPMNPQFVRGGSLLAFTVGTGDPQTITQAVALQTINTGMGFPKLILAVMAESDTTVNGVSINGVSMNRIAQVINSGSTPDIWIDVFELDLTANTIGQTITIDFTGAMANAPMVARFHLYGVGSIGTPKNASGNATGAAVTGGVDVARGGAILAFSIRETAGQTITWTGVDEENQVNSVAATLQVGYAQRYLCDAETGRTVQAVGSASGQYVTLAIPFNP